MKQTLIILILLNVNLNTLVGQTLSEDQQWFMRDGNVKNGANLSNNFYYPINGIDQYIRGVSHPSQDISASDPGATGDVDFANKFFAIGKTGKYYFYTDTDNPTDPSEVGSGYKLPFANKYKHLYLTNVYEDDDPPPNVRMSGNVISNAREILLQEGSGLFGSNQDIIHNRDFTFVIDESHINSLGEYTLCYEPLVHLDIEPSKFNDHGYHIIADGSELSQSNYKNSNLTSNCLYLEGTGKNQFINFRARVTDLTAFDFDDELTFKLYGGIVEKPSEKTPVMKDTSISISERFHDPNYVEVQCVWIESPQECYVRYRVFCYNESPSGEVDNVSMSMTLPDCFDTSSNAITKLLVNVGNAQQCNSADFTYSNSVLNIEFNNKLEMFNSAVNDRVSAYIEFCARLKTDYCDKDMLQVMDLQPSDPETRFENGNQVAYYPIVDFIDPIASVKDRNCTPLEKADDTSREICVFTQRPNEVRAVGTAGDGNCKCEVLCEEEDYIWIIIAAFVVAVFSFLYFRNR